MKNRILLSGLVVAAGFLAQPATAQINVNVLPALAPNINGSPSFDAWTANAITALRNGTAAEGVAGTPSYYTRCDSLIAATEMMVTSFNSWRGQASPGTAFGPGFAGELGNRLLFGLVVNGGGKQFAISQLSFTLTSSDPGNGLGVTFNPGDYTYGAGYVGVLFGANGIWGGGDDTLVTSGPSTQLVDALIGRGSGNAFWPKHSDGDGLSDQQVLDTFAGTLKPDFPVVLTATYSIVYDSGPAATGQASVTVIPEASTYAAWLGLLTLACVALRRRLRNDSISG